MNQPDSWGGYWTGAHLLYFCTLALEFNNSICSQVDVELVFPDPLMESLDGKVALTVKCLENIAPR